MTNKSIKDIEERLLPLELKQPFYGFHYRYYYKNRGRRDARSLYAKNTQELISKLKEHETAELSNVRELTEKRFMAEELNEELIEKLDKELMDRTYEYNPTDYIGRRKRNHYLGERNKYFESMPFYKRIINQLIK